MPEAAILITRPEPGAAATALRVAAMGLRAVVAPIVKIAPRAIRPGRTKFQAILLTSGNAVAALPPELRDHLLLAVGDATAAQADAAGFHHCHSAAGDAVALEALATRLCAPLAGPLLLASGEGQGLKLATALRRHGFRVIRRVAYTARPVSALPEAARLALSENALDVALFFSTDSARAFVRLLTKSMPPRIVAHIDAIAISKSTASALAPLPWRRIRVASAPNQDEMLALLS